jgi:peptide/nickel transport system substrate-binding protein
MEKPPLDVLTILQSSVRSGDPHTVSDSVDRNSILAAVYESLVSRSMTGAYVPCLAESWSVEGDAMTWMFRLRQRVSFHNGDVLTSSDVVATMGRVLDPSIGGAFGTQGVFASYLGDAVIEPASKYSVKIVTSEPMADLLDLVVAMPIAPKSALGDLPETYVGSGPYKVAESGESHLVMEAFDDHWGGVPPAQELHWRAMRGPEERASALIAGQADLASGLTHEGAKAVEASGVASTVERDSNLCIIFMCNASSGVCADRRVRQVLNLALDQDRVIEEAVGGAAKPTNGIFTPLHFGHDPATPAYPYDPDAARALLVEAGYGDGMDLVVDIPTRMPDEARDLAGLMGEMYSPLGINVLVKEHEDRQAYAEMVRAKQINDVCCFDSSPLSTFRVLREKIHSGRKGPWWEGYSNEEVDALIDEAERTLDESRRRRLYRRAYRLIRDDAPWIFLYSPVRFWGVGPRLEGWRPGIDGVIRFT